MALGWIAWQSFRIQRNWFLAVTCAALLLVSLLGLFIPTAGWLALTFQALLGIAILVLVWQVWMRPLSFGFKIAVSLVGLTLLVTSLFQGLDPAATVLGLSNLPVSSGLLFNLGELLVLISVVALWWTAARQAGWKYLVDRGPASRCLYCPAPARPRHDRHYDHLVDRSDFIPALAILCGGVMAGRRDGAPYLTAGGCGRLGGYTCWLRAALRLS